MTATLKRTHQAILLSLLLVICLAYGIIGFSVTQNSPIPVSDSGRPFSELDTNSIQSIAGIAVQPEFFLRLPEFFRRSDENRWWRAHREMFDKIQQHDQISVVYHNHQGRTQSATYVFVKPSAGLVLKKLGLIYLSVLLYILNAVSIFFKHRNPQGVTLTFFLMFCALYFICGAPVVGRSVTIDPSAFGNLINFLHIASSGLILIVYFAWIFPEPKKILGRLPFPAFIIVGGHAVTTSTLYAAKVISFGSTLPNLIFWVVVAITGFMHSLLTEKDRFLKKQIALTLFVPVLASSVFVIFSVLPAALGGTAMRFTSFALFSLIVPFSLAAAMDNVSMYQQRIAAEKSANREKEKLRQDLHDDTLNRLANIALLSANTAGTASIANGTTTKLKAIKTQAISAIGHIRGMLWITDERYGSWEDFGSQLRSQGYDLASSQQIQFTLEVSASPKSLDAPTLAEKKCLYHVFIEAISNAIKHSGANNIWVSMTAATRNIELRINDDGCGLNPNKETKSSYGLANIRHRVKQLGGNVVVDSPKSSGMRISVNLPRS